MAKVEFVSLRKCFEDGWTEAVLATAIEAKGIYTWDRYGRFKHFKLDSQEANRVLDVLAASYAASHAGGADDDVDDDSPDSLLRLCGWPRLEVPDFRSFDEAEQAPSRPTTPAQSASGTKLSRTDLALIGGLLLFIRGELGNQPHPDYVDDMTLSKELEDKVGEYHGCKQRTIRKKFEEALELMKEP